MPKLILKSPYIKCGGKGGGGGGYLRYIGTRDGVELVPDDRPATKRQEQLIRSLVRDFPDSKDLFEYADWETTHTKAHASAFITTALECNWEQANRSDMYLKYIATRPRVERLGSHGLFGDNDGVDLQQAAAELDSYTGNVWTHIISLKREDAARLGYINFFTVSIICKKHGLPPLFLNQPKYNGWQATIEQAGCLKWRRGKVRRTRRSLKFCWYGSNLGQTTAAKNQKR